MEETKKGSGTTDLTVGRPLPQILKFALPLVLGTLFQQLAQCELDCSVRN